MSLIIPQITDRMYSDINHTMFTNYIVTGCINGHIKTLGRHAGLMKNPIWIIQENGKEIFLMFCEEETIVKLCRTGFLIIKEYERMYNGALTWYLGKNGYIAAHIPNSNTSIYMHQLVMDCFGNGRGTSKVSIDHIDRNPLNNCMDNLRIATREEQENNSRGIMPNTKRTRQINARPLPEGITHEMLRKYIVYYFNIYDKKNNKSREYFRVEGHPKLKKPWETSKSGKISIFEKLKQANQFLDNLDRDIIPDSNIQA